VKRCPGPSSPRPSFTAFPPYDSSSSAIAAEARARTLLLSLLSAEQRIQFKTRAAFTVHVKGRGTFYIFARLAFNVVHASTGDCYCCTTDLRVPIWDLMLSQKLLLETDPDHFFRVANCKRKLLMDTDLRPLHAQA
jgi:hypothetical protein